MNIEKDIKDDILKRAEKLLYFNNLLIKQCDSWLPFEESNLNMEKRIWEKRKSGKKWYLNKDVK